MWTRTEFEQLLARLNISGGPWGQRGEELVAELETALAVPFSTELRRFGQEFGNLRLGPFEIVVAGDAEGSLSCITETQAMRSANPTAPAGLVKLMDHAGESYCATPAGSIEVYDSNYVRPDQTTQRFASLTAFLDWLVRECESLRTE